MNARGTDEEVFACVLTCGVSARRSAGGKTSGGGATAASGRERTVCAGKGDGRASNE